MERKELVKELKEGIAQRGSCFLVVVPTYKEIENIRKLIYRLVNGISVPVEIVVVDDNSPDGTAEAVIELKHSIQNLHLFRRNGRMGLGSAYLAGFQLVRDAGIEYVITMDSDLSHDPEVINRMAEEIKDCDMVIGSRYIHDGKVLDFELWRIVLSKGGNFIAKILLGLKTKDCTSGFRCYRAEVLSALDVEQNVHSRRYIFLAELLFLLSRHGFRINEIPIIFRNRVAGKTKVNFKEMIHGLWTIFKLSVRFHFFPTFFSRKIK